MPAVASLTWSGNGAGESSNGPTVDRTLKRRYTVIDAADQLAALAAIGLPKINDEFNPGSAFRVKDRDASNDGGPLTWSVDVLYAIPANGQFTPPIDNPVARAALVSWGRGFRQVPVDRDATGKLIRNSAGDFFDPLPVRDFPVETLTIKRFEPFYDRTKARKYVNKVNSNSFIVGDTEVLPFECKCTNIGPTSEYEVNAATIEIAYEFEIILGLRAPDKPNESGNPFDFHRTDAGRRGWFTKDSKTIKGYFCTAETVGGVLQLISILTEPVLLDGTGRPLDTTIKVADRDDSTAKVYEPVATPVSEDAALTAEYTSPFSTAKAKTWLFSNADEISFTGIFP